MKNKTGQPENPDLLRRKAEEISRKNEAGSPESLATDSVEEPSWIVHELRVHQIELEMQNEELCRTHAELEEEHQQYLDLYDFAPVGYCTLSEQGQITATNLTATAMLGIPRDNLIGQQITSFICDDDQHTFTREMKELFATRVARSCELRMKKQTVSSSGPAWNSF